MLCEFSVPFLLGMYLKPLSIDVYDIMLILYFSAITAMSLTFIVRQGMCCVNHVLCGASMDIQCHVFEATFDQHYLH